MLAGALLRAAHGPRPRRPARCPGCSTASTTPTRATSRRATIACCEDAESGAYAGIGVAVLRAHGGLLVTASIPHLPASRAGLRAGDLITTIDGRSLVSLSYRSALDLMAGDEGTPVSLRVRPSDGGHAERVTLVRRSIAEPVVASRTIHAHGASYQYLRLFGFPASAAQLGAAAGAAGGAASRRRPHPRPARQSGRAPVAGGGRLEGVRRPRRRRQHGRAPRAGAVVLCKRHRGRQAPGGRPDRPVDRERRRGHRRERFESTTARSSSGSAASARARSRRSSRWRTEARSS